MFVMGFPTSYAPGALFSWGSSVRPEMQQLPLSMISPVRRPAGARVIRSTQTGESPNNSRQKPSDVVEGRPQSNLGKQLKAIRQEAIAEGLKLLTPDEVLTEIQQRRGDIDGGG